MQSPLQLRALLAFALEERAHLADVMPEEGAGECLFVPVACLCVPFTCAVTCFRNSAAARPNGLCFGHAATIFRSGRGGPSERYSGKFSVVADRHCRDERNPHAATHQGLNGLQLGARKIDIWLRIPPLAKGEHLVAQAVTLLHHNQTFFFEVGQSYLALAR